MEMIDIRPMMTYSYVVEAYREFMTYSNVHISKGVFQSTQESYCVLK
jgi:hypothetical protein